MEIQHQIEQFEQSGEFRVLRRVDLAFVPNARDVQPELSHSAVLVVDTETTGVDPERCGIIEFAARVVWADEDGRVIALGDSFSWFEDPGAPLEPKIRQLTGLTDDDLRGHRIDEAAVGDLLYPGDGVVSHNAKFDRAFVERRFPAWKNLGWACSMAEIAWPTHGFDGRGLQSLLMQAGWFASKSHRAGADVDAVIALLMHRFEDTNQTALAELLEAAKRTTWRVSAAGANLDTKNALRDRGYRWNPRDCVWQIEVEEHDLGSEKSWLSANVYAPRHRPAASEPKVARITWRERHAA